jgi:hypothetical protein
MNAKSMLVHNDVVQAMIADNVDPYERPLRPTEDMLVTQATSTVKLGKPEKQTRHNMKRLREFSKNLKFVEAKSRAKTASLQTLTATPIKRKKKYIRETQDMRSPSGATYCQIFPLPSATSFFDGDVCYGLHPISKLLTDMDRGQAEKTGSVGGVADRGSNTSLRDEKGSEHDESRGLQLHSDCFTDPPVEVERSDPSKRSDLPARFDPLNRSAPLDIIEEDASFKHSPARESVAMSPINPCRRRELTSPSPLPPVSPMKAPPALRKVKIGYGDVGSSLRGGVMVQGPARPAPPKSVTQNCDMATTEELDGGPGSRLRPIKGVCITTAQRFPATALGTKVSGKASHYLSTASW